MDTKSQEVMQEFVEGLKEAYRERQLSCEEQWPPVRGDRLIKLQLVEADKTEGFRAGLPQHGAPDDKVKRTPILHGDLFKVEEGKKPVRKLIVEGNAGIGKTTLCTMLTEEWANGEILTQFDCVLLLPLRDQLVASASSLSDLLPLYHPDETVCGSVVQQLKRTRGKGVLIIADGWDELSEEKRSKNSFVYHLLFGRLLPSASVLLTSRPAASAHLHNLPTVDRLVEVVGFNEENVKQYIESEFEKCPEKASSLIEQLENNPLIASVCSVPLNCAIICNVWQTLDRTLPSTLTELYSHIVLNVILRNLKKRNMLENIIAFSLDSIPEDLLGVFWLTCKFAYECLSQDKIVFTQKEIAPLFPQVLDSSYKTLSFGLLQCAQSLLPVGQGLSFHFVHLTIQEFLAALHLVTLPNEEKLKACAAHAVSVRFAMVWRFVFGLGCQKEGSYSRKVVCLDDEVIDRIIFAQKDLCLVLCHCAMESQSGDVSAKIGKQINKKLEGQYFNIAFTPYDCVAVFHVLCHTSHFSDLTLVLNNCGLTDKLLNELTDILSSANCMIQVGELYLRGNKITSNGITDLFNRASASSLSSLRRLCLSNNSITNIPLKFSSCSSLTVVQLSDNPLGVTGIQSLETAVQAGVLVNVWSLYLAHTLTDDAYINGALLATLSPSIASHCPHLRLLRLSRNNLGVPGVSALGGLFTISRSKLRLELSNVNINAEAAYVFIVSTISNKPPRDLALNLSNNPLGYDGLLAIFRILRSETCSITELNLSNTDLTTSVTTESQYHNVLSVNRSSISSLGPVLENSRLTVINLDENDFSGNNIFILAECVQRCKLLSELSCQGCSLTSKEVIMMLDHCSGSSLKNLCVWDLINNSIDDKGVNALIENAPKLFPNLEGVILWGNPVSGQVEERLKNMLNANTKKLESREEAQEEVWRSVVLTEWERTHSPPQNEEMFQTFQEMWDELLVHCQHSIDSVQSTDNWIWSLPMVTCEIIPAKCDPQQKDSTPVEAPALPSDDKSFHSATEKLDEPVGPPPTATHEPTTVQSPHRMYQQETMSSDGIAEVTTPPQITPHPHDTLSAIPELTLSVLDRELKTLTKPIQFAIKLGIPQYRIEVIQQDHRHDTEGQKVALFQYIAKNHKSVGITWSSIADALRDIHAGDLSLRIREQYCSHRDVYFQVE